MNYCNFLALFIVISLININHISCDDWREQIVDDYSEMKNKVKVAYTYSQNPEQKNLSEVYDKRVLHHINKYLGMPTLELKDDKDIVLTVTQYNGLIRINGQLMYNIIPRFAEKPYIQQCTDLMGPDPYERRLAQKYRQCRALQLSCELMYSHKSDIVTAQEMFLQDFDKFNSSLVITHVDDSGNITLADVSDRNELLQIKAFVEKKPEVKFLRIANNDGLIFINNEMYYEIAQMTFFTDRIYGCLLKYKIMYPFATHEAFRYFHANCAATIIGCEQAPLYD